MTLYIRSSPHGAGEALPLDRCSDARDFEGMAEPCPTGCLAHFDAWADPRHHYETTGEAYSPYPNSILSWIEYLPGTRLLQTWNQPQHTCPKPPAVSVRLCSNDRDFLQPSGDAVPVWTVAVEGLTSISHYVALFPSLQSAESFLREEVRPSEEDCGCAQPTNTAQVSRRQHQDER